MSEGFQMVPRSGDELTVRAAELIARFEAKFDDVESSYVRYREIISTIETKLNDVLGIASAALAAKTQIADEQAVIAVKSAHIQSAQEHADSVRAELDRIHTSAKQQATEIEGQQQRVESAATSVGEVFTDIQQRALEINIACEGVLASQEKAVAASMKSKTLADKAENTEEIIEAYEKRLSELEAQSKAQLETITSLLPGATAAGLAHAFDDRRKTFLKPGQRWQELFVGSIALLVLLALSGLWNIYSEAVPLTWNELVLLWLARLPIAAALVWLALHSSREAALAKRLEEDYGYKAAIAASFQGFQKQMGDIASSRTESSPLARLCEDTLATIANPPGRIYEREQLSISPSEELVGAATNATGLAKSGGLNKSSNTQ
ncbi:hypothetical protein [Achromobacter sp. ACRQX]|uniref:hypothetical protein n=1 Tax=Achromobacter sp. ACRQX TaxID=2918181 RepID=UPI001EF342D9|nr:hypothetical protein [Achromobacter sp. ACRQX]MCG7324622.1 hypothetical protein [Achromobacter sp. ACRQX]